MVQVSQTVNRRKQVIGTYLNWIHAMQRVRDLGLKENQVKWEYV